jgi:hypothetical protein
MDDERLQELATTIITWLSYQVLCGRQTLLSESYLGQPIAEFLTPLFPDRIIAEWTSPQLKISARGRPRQLDYALLSRDASHPVTTIEAKWVATGTLQKQRIVDDVMRLESVRIAAANEKVRHTSRYLILAGTPEPIARSLDSDVRDNGQYKFFPMFLPFNDTAWNKILVRDAPPAIRPFFKDFAKAYSLPLPTSYRTRRIVDEANAHSRVLIWEIQSSRKRATFDSKDRWADVQIAEDDGGAEK